MILQGPVAALDARVRVPGSKSLTNRALVASAVAGGGVIRGPLDCDDTRVLAEALRTAGWPLSWGRQIEVGPRLESEQTAEIWMADSGTGARLLLALLAATPGRFVVDGSERLRERPMAPLIEALDSLGANLTSRNGHLPVAIEGRRLDGGAVDIRPEVSSQFVSALMLAAPLMRDGLEIRVAGAMPSRPYVDLTEDTLRTMGVAVIRERSTWSVAPGVPRPVTTTVEGDWSAAAFFVAAASVTGGRLEVGPLSSTSRQGDRVVVKIAREAGVEVTESELGIVIQGPARRPFKANLEHAPDLFPALAAAAAAGPPGSIFQGLAHLQHKESNRLAVMVENLRAVGAELEVTDTSATIAGVATPRTSPCPVSAAHDHRIAMAMAVTALFAGPLELDHPECVSKSFPEFWPEWRRMLDAGGTTGAW